MHVTRLALLHGLALCFIARCHMLIFNVIVLSCSPVKTLSRFTAKI